MKIKLTFKGMDSWDRSVYEDENGKLWKDVDPRKNRTPDLCTSVNNEFEGEPNTNMGYMSKYDNAEIEFIPERITW
jgi:hypothetical protein